LGRTWAKKIPDSPPGVATPKTTCGTIRIDTFAAVGLDLKKKRLRKEGRTIGWLGCNCDSKKKVLLLRR